MMVTRREFSRVAAGASIGLTLGARAAARQRIAPTIRIIGAAAYRSENGGVTLYLPQAADHRPFLFAHVSMFPNGQALPRGFPFKSFHRELANAVAEQYRASCLKDARISIPGSTVPEIAATELADIGRLAREANKNATFVGGVPPSYASVTLTGGAIVDAPPTPSKGHTASWQFWYGGQPFGAHALTDITQFEGDNDIAFPLPDGRRIDIKGNQPHKLWIVNMPAGRSCRDPQELHHGDHYYDFFNATGVPPVKRPRAYAATPLECNAAVSFDHPCPSDVNVLIPPDSEFCFQALV